MSNIALGADFEPDTGNSDFNRINYHRLYLGEAAQKSVIHHKANRPEHGELT